MTRKDRHHLIVWLLAVLVLIAACADGRLGPELTTSADPPSSSGAAGMNGKLVIFHAGSLTVPVDKLTEAFQERHHDVTFETEGAGSRTTARKVSELGRSADLVMSADYTVIDNLLIPDFADWNIRFARNAMVIAYTDHAKFADEISGDNWYDVLLRDGILYGHSDPDADPCGYRTLMVWQLAEEYYDEPGLFDRLDANCPPGNVRPKETDLLALLQSGDMDYAFSYRSIAVQHGLNLVQLPQQINLSMVEHADLYRHARVELTGSDPGETIVTQGKPIVYGVTVPKVAASPDLALDFVRFLLGPEGQSIMDQQGQPPIVPAQAGDKAAVPAELQDLTE